MREMDIFASPNVVAPFKAWSGHLRKRHRHSTSALAALAGAHWLVV